MKNFRKASALALLIFTAGCFSDPSSGNGCNTGEAGRDNQVLFSYQSAECLLGCDIEAPMMTGTLETLQLEAAGGGALPKGLTARASNDGVVLLGALVTQEMCCVEQGNSDSCGELGEDTAEGCTGTVMRSYQVSASALAEGSSDLEVFTADGEALDTFRLEVRDPAEVVFTCRKEAAVAASDVDLAVGDRCDFTVTPRSAGGQDLQASIGLSTDIGDPSVAILRDDAFLDFTPEGQTESVETPAGHVEARAAGSTNIVVKAGPISRSFPVVVH